jgi:hypothetical protein
MAPRRGETKFIMVWRYVHTKGKRQKSGGACERASLFDQ